jgi:hypothetical protein
MSAAFDQTLHTADSAPAPGGNASRDSIHRAKARHGLNETEPEGTIQPGHELAFYWLRHDQTGSYGLVSCHVNGQPSALVVAARGRHDSKKIGIMPLFVALTPNMRITDLDGDVIWGDEGVA